MLCWWPWAELTRRTVNRWRADCYQRPYRFVLPNVKKKQGRNLISSEQWNQNHTAWSYILTEVKRTIQIVQSERSNAMQNEHIVAGPIIWVLDHASVGKHHFMSFFLFLTQWNKLFGVCSSSRETTRVHAIRMPNSLNFKGLTAQDSSMSSLPRFGVPDSVFENQFAIKFWFLETDSQ